jgi:predicted O-methyltransferase YrrM
MSHEFLSPLRRWDVVAGLCAEAKTCVEVGCKDGRTTAHVLEQCPDVRVVAIDPWAALPNAAEDYTDHNFKQIENAFWERVGAHKERVDMLRMTSLEAVKALKDELFDVVFIDAGHDYDNAFADISAWWPMVRDDGFLCGHDFQQKFSGVMRAVAHHFPLMRVGVCPDSVWVVQKTERLQRRAA